MNGCQPPEEAGETASDPISYESALAAVRAEMPGERYVYEGVVEAAASLPDSYEGPMELLTMAMPWYLNDELAPFYLAQELGYFAAQGLEVTLLPGGPGVDPLLQLATGKVDVAMPSRSQQYVRFLAHSKNFDLVTFAALVAHSPASWIGLDADTPRDQPSPKKLTPEDLLGRRIGVLRGFEFSLRAIEEHNGLPAGGVEMTVGRGEPGPMLAGAVDFFSGWVINAPRMLEAEGYYNWVAFELGKFGFDEYCDPLVVTRETMETRPDLPQRIVKALLQAHDYLFAHPDEAAAITLEYAVQGGLSLEMIRRRFEMQPEFLRPRDGSPLLSVQAARFDDLVAKLYQYGELELGATP